MDLSFQMGRKYVTMPSRKAYKLKITPKKGQASRWGRRKEGHLPIGDEVFWGSAVQNFIQLSNVSSVGLWVVSSWLSYHSSWWQVMKNVSFPSSFQVPEDKIKPMISENTWGLKKALKFWNSKTTGLGWGEGKMRRSRKGSDAWVQEEVSKWKGNFNSRKKRMQKELFCFWN